MFLKSQKFTNKVLEFTNKVLKFTNKVLKFTNKAPELASNRHKRKSAAQIHE
ncbi:hypothetical protein [Peribacillus muralis]|uniref:hypothetical protein n=1 Tax=Peribacillus muralis TaxID=264697 RepID=UPI00366DA687